MSEFVAGAFIDVKPDATGFRAKMIKDVNRSIQSAGVFKVPVAFDLKAFKKQLAAEARGAKARIPIEVGGNVAEIRKAINAKITAATAGMKIKVPVEVVTSGPGSRGGPGARGGGAGGAAATDRAAASTKKLTEAEQLRAQVQKTLIALDTRAAVTQSLLTSASEQGLSVEERAQRLRDARTSANAAVRTSTEQLAKASAVLTAQQRQQLEAAQRSAFADRTAVTAQQKKLATSTAEAKAIGKARDARKSADTELQKEIKSITSLNALHAVENDLMAAEAALKAATTRARQLGLASQVAENQARLTAIGLQKQAIVAQRNEIKGEGKRLTQQKTGLRGAASSILSLLGIRGATLAASGAFLAGAASAAVFAKSLGSFASFERELNTFQAITGASVEELEKASAAAKILGEDIKLPSVSAADAAQAMTELARAGLDVTNSLNGARGVLELAAAAQIDNAEAATLTASALNAFELEGEEAVHVADLLANAANAAQGSISEMGAAMQQAAAIAHQVGITLDDTIAILTIFAQRGLRGSDAGTSFRTAMARLIAPTKKAATLIDDLGLNIRDAQGNIRPEVFAEFGEATKNLPPALRDMAAEIIAGQDSIRAFAIGASAGARGLERARIQMAQEGAAARVAAARTKGLAGSFNALSSNVETLGITLGGFAAGPVQTATDSVTGLVHALNQLVTGDFGGFKESLDALDARAAEGGKRRIEGLAGTVKNLATLDFGNLGGSLSKLFQNAPKDKDRVDLLLESLERIQTLKLQTFDIGLDVKPLDKELKFLQGELRKAKIEAGLLIPITPLEKAVFPLKQALATAKELRAEALKATGGQPTDFTAELDRIISQSTAKLRIKIRAFKLDAVKELSGKDLAKGFAESFRLIALEPKNATPEVLNGIDDMIRDISKVGVGSAPASLGKKVVKSLQDAINAAVDADDPELAEALKAKVIKIAALFGIQWADAFKNIKVPLTADDVAETLLPERIAGLRAEAFGTVAGQIAAKEAELAGLTKSLGGVRKNTEDEAQVLQDIIAVQGEIAALKDDTDAQAGADKVLEAISAREERLLNKAALAELTETLNDDLAAARALRVFYIKQIEVVKATIKDKEKRNDAVRDLTQKLFELNLEIAGDIKARADKIFDDAAEKAAETVSLQDDLNVARRKVRFWERQVKIMEDLVRKRKATVEQLKAAQEELDDAEDDAKEALRNRRQQRRENVQERLELKIEIAESNGNLKAEIAAREAQIRNTKQLIRQTRKGSLQRLRLIAELRREQRELRDLKKEKEKATEDAKALIFAFLQAQQGFAANLLSNLVPFHLADNALGAAGAGVPGTTSTSSGGGTVSTVGGALPAGVTRGDRGGPPVFPVGDVLAREAVVQAATKPQQGFTNTQATRLLALTAQMVSLLGGRVTKNAHPQSRVQRAASRATGDVE